ncbi:MAG: DUF1735 domain-containing protein [Cyclobacteriaceae bacterium]|nr:DUF1735 domain-containing protein [Cyclobacteriaceae bacterium]
MKRIIYYLSIFVLLTGILVSGCKKEETTSSVYIPEATEFIKGTFDITDTLEFTVTLVGADYATVSATAGNAINVTFRIDENLVSEVNQSLGTDYSVLPANNYELETSATIAGGQNSSGPVKLIIKKGDALESWKSFILPVSIDQVTGAELSAYQTTVYFVVTRAPALENAPLLDRTGWTIDDFSTEEPGEGGGNGLAITVLDDNFGTFWHSQWAGGEPQPPHYITIDMGATTTIHGISIIDRYFEGDWAIYGHGQPKKISISLREDGSDEWIDDITWDVPLPPTDNAQSELRTYLNMTREARYLRITVEDVYATWSTSIAEVYAL